MGFYKTGEAPIVEIYCSCGKKIQGNEKKCEECKSKKTNKEKPECSTQV